MDLKPDKERQSLGAQVPQIEAAHTFHGGIESYPLSKRGVPTLSYSESFESETQPGVGATFRVSWEIAEAELVCWRLETP